ncbi:MAG TPA: hypothetical protein VNL14_23360 [Candidatus Acidoferrales bacterium]|nr:hypothetical protein [Candidatus Acidoferrales bacterium]
MADQIVLEEEKTRVENPPGDAVKAEASPTACPVQGKGWLKGPLGMAICCGAPLLLVAAISFFGLSLGAVASGALSLAAVLACPVGMYLVMRMMMNRKN